MGFSEARPILVHPPDSAASGTAVAFDPAEETTISLDKLANQPTTLVGEGDAAQNTVSAPVPVDFKGRQEGGECAVKPAISGKHETNWVGLVGEGVEDIKLG